MDSESKNSVLIAGCGWLGKKLGQHLNKLGYQVFGTTRSRENFDDLQEHGIHPVQLNLPGEPNITPAWDSYDTVIISISPGRGENRDQYPGIIEQLAQLLDHANGQLMLFSSTSVYNGLKGRVTESDCEPAENHQNVLVRAEALLRKYRKDSLILRLAGLTGEDRHPVKYLAGRKAVKDGEAPVNLVHREDIIEAVRILMDRDVRNEIFNICAGKHPSRKEIYTRLARKFDMEEPTFESGGKEGKKISSDKIKEWTGMTFRHPDPLEFEGEPG